MSCHHWKGVEGMCDYKIPIGQRDIFDHQGNHICQSSIQCSVREKRPVDVHHDEHGNKMELMLSIQQTYP